MTRRGLRPLLPAFAARFGIMPWHIDPIPPVLTRAELDVFVDYLTAQTERTADG